ncbi:uncharacterized protein LOC130698168 [Daphnia carinata]|uniref:uncharacterized protein LOC130698168 n=1 Tax=Daphnia carinata TaxID=120202 RepID=UPI00257D8729|nr:uncharacterized protein LOC130698168 [Daphnia carinata]
MSASVRNFRVILLLFLTVLSNSVTSNVFFPAETSEELVHYRSLKDILFRSQAEDTARSIESPVVASFRPSNPSPTLASSPQNGVGVSRIRFLETDAFFVPNFPEHSHADFISSPAFAQTEGRRPNRFHSDVDARTVLTRAAANESTIDVRVVEDPGQDRWPWPYSKSVKQTVNVQSRQLAKPTTLVVKKSVAKPYRLLTRTSSCPKLLHDLTVTCSLPKQHDQFQTVEFQWYKTQHKSVTETQNNLLDSTVKIPIAFGTQVIHKDARYIASVASHSANLTIRQLKPQDCGSYICEAVDIPNATVISTTEFLIFLCY